MFIILFAPGAGTKVTGVDGSANNEAELTTVCWVLISDVIIDCIWLSGHTQIWNH